MSRLKRGGRVLKIGDRVTVNDGNHAYVTTNKFDGVVIGLSGNASAFAFKVRYISHKGMLWNTYKEGWYFEDYFGGWCTEELKWPSDPEPEPIDEDHTRRIKSS